MKNIDTNINIKEKAMKKALLALLTLGTIITLLLCGCSSEGKEPAATEGQTQKPTEQGANTGSYVVSTMSELRALEPRESSALVVLKGYHSANDGGGGTFYYDAASELEPDGALVIKCESTGGRFVRDREENYVNVKWFGAKGDGKTDDTAALQAAISSLGTGGGTVSLPGGNYAISAPLTIGDGDSGEKVSSTHGVKLIGMGGGFSHNVAAATTIKATAEIDNMLVLRGRISDCEIGGIYFNANNKAKTCLSLNSFSGCYFHNVKAMGFTDIGIKAIAGTAPTGNYNIYNRFESVNVTCLSDKTTGILFDGHYGDHNDTWLTVLSDCRFDTAQSENSVAAHFKFVDSISFYRCHFNTYKESSTGAVFDALDNHNFPCGMAFHDCSMTSHDVWEDSTHTIRKQYFYGFGTYDNEQIPTHPKLIGMTDMGDFFNIDAIDLLLSGNKGEDGTEEDNGEFTLPAKSGRVDTDNSTGASEHHNLKNGDKLAVLVNAKNKLVGGSFYLSSYDNSIGTIKFDVYKWDTDYATTVAGEILASDTALNFKDNSQFEAKFDGLSSGYYLIVISGTAPDDDFGVAVWTRGKSMTSVTFKNGNRIEAGLRGQFITE